MAKTVKSKRGGRAPAKTAVKSDSSARVRKITDAQAKAKLKKEAGLRPPLPGSFRLTGQTLSTIRKFWKPLGGILLVYLVLSIIFVSGLLSSFSSTVGTIKSNLHPSSGQHVDKFSNALNGFGSLITGSNSSQGTSVMQSVLLVIGSLVIIWALRQLLAGEPIGVKQAYYRSMTPLIPFLLVVFVIILQLLPLTIGTAILALILGSVSASSALATTIFSLIFVLLAAWSIYMISGSIFALYIVTLPDMQPRRALRSAKNLVKLRRWQLMRKLLFLPIVVLLAIGIFIIPLIFFASFLVAAVFFGLTIVTILFVHTYLYSLYRSLIA